MKGLERQTTNATRRKSLDRHIEDDGIAVDTELAFDHDFTTVEDDLLFQSHSTYRDYHDQLQASSSHLENLISSTQETSELLSTLSGSFKAVETRTDLFRQQCEALITEQKRLEGLATSIESNSRYYDYLEPMTRRLNAPGAANLVKSKEFTDMLSNLDHCLSYMEAHLTHREAATYRSRYRLLLTRALTLIRQHVTRSLGEIAADISKRIQGNQLKDTTHSALLYAKFRVPAPELKALGLEIQKRAVPTPEDVDAGREPEYLGLMRELYQSYSTTRGRLILPLVTRKMTELQQTNTQQQTDVIAFSQAGITYMRGICLDEYDLWFEWFNTDGALTELLENLMEPMYDYLRPRIIHETKIEKLCDLCAMIQSRYMDLDSEEDEDEGMMSGANSPVANGKLAGRKLDFGSLVLPVLEDAQTRLVFLAVNALRDGIESYKPKPENLDFPKKATDASVNGSNKSPVLSGRRTAKTATPKSPTDETKSIEGFSEKPTTSQIVAAMKWYPTLVLADLLLRRIYRLVNSTVFDDLAHRVVHSTIHSLIYASQQIARSKDKTPQDGQLFLITHLLCLKQRIVSFDIEFSPPEVEFDFSSVTNTFYELRDRGSLWNPASWVRLVGGAVGGGLLPKVVKNMLDAKAELDGQLRTVINEFVTSYASHITAPIDSSVVADAALAQDLSKKDGSGFDASKAVRTIRGLAEKDVPLLRAKLDDFVEDVRTRETLIAAVRDQVVMTYEDFFDAQSEGSGRKIGRKGKGRENEVWDPVIFGEAMGRIFQVGRIVGDDFGEEDEDQYVQTGIL